MGIQTNPEQEIELFDDFHVFEILDEHQREVNLGEEGDLVLTNLYNYTQPLIRYQINDVLQKGHDPKSERGFLTIRSVNGRRGISLEFKNQKGETVKIIHNMLLGFLSPSAQRFQFFQTKPDELLIKIKLTSCDPQHVHEAKLRVNAILAKHDLLGTVTSKVEVVDELLCNPKTGKFELIRPFDEKRVA